MRMTTAATAFCMTIVFTGSAQKKSRPTTLMVPDAPSHRQLRHSWPEERKWRVLWKRQKTILMKLCWQVQLTVSGVETVHCITSAGNGNRVSDNSPWGPAYGVIGKSRLLHKIRAVNISSIKNDRMREITFNHLKIRTAKDQPLRQHDKGV